jgi:pyridoxamine 5'-phosphate oxidase
LSHSADIAAIRTDYRKAALDEVLAGDDALAFFSRWFDEAVAAQIDEVNAMTLATCDAGGKPHARIVLLKGLESDGFVFYTNYDSDKGIQLASNPYAALVFFWKELERQVRIEGRIEKLDASSSDAYFYSRPAGSRLGAWASPQSRVIPDRSVLDTNYKKYQEQFSDHIPRPLHWGGYTLVPRKIEFWQGRSSRMHDRIVFERDGAAWTKCRLAP